MEECFSDRVRDAAARWYARLRAPDCTDEDRAAFEKWRAADPAHAACYFDAERLGRLLRTDPRLAVMAEDAFAGGAGPRPFRWVPGAVAAGIVAGVLIAGFTSRSQAPNVEPGRAHTAAATHTLTLEDGSTVQLDVQSGIEWRFSDDEREVRLSEGRAIFDVARDESRPFTVVAGPSRVTAVGTRFQVERTAKATVVTLAEGAITVADDSSGAPLVERLAPGEELSIPLGEPAWMKRTVDARAATSWSVGRHVFREMPLGNALDDVNRYAAVKVRLADPTLASLPVSGTFLAGDSRVIVSAFAAVLPLRVEDASGELVVHRQGAGTADAQARE